MDGHMLSQNHVIKVDKLIQLQAQVKWLQDNNQRLANMYERDIREKDKAIENLNSHMLAMKNNFSMVLAEKSRSRSRSKEEDKKGDQSKQHKKYSKAKKEDTRQKRKPDTRGTGQSKTFCN
jgi:hypothetical protein